jgi:microcin C transport system permease protein
MLVTLSPITRLRLRQFRRNRRAWVALWLLVALGVIAALPELLCNGRPLMLRFEGHTRFPFLRYYTQDTFLHNGQFAPVDYRALVRSPAFMQGRSNLAVFAPIPFGPNEVLDASAFEPYRRVTLSVTPVVETGRLSLSPAGRITRAEGCAPFFPDGVTTDPAFTNHWPLTPDLRQALALRFANTAAPALEATLVHRTNTAGRLVVSLTAYEPRAAAPATVRLTLNPAQTDANRRLNWRLKRADATLASVPSEWRPVAVALLATTRVTGAPASTNCPWGSGQAHVTLTRSDVTWPHRPVPGHWMGVDAAGRDVLARVLHGLRTSLLFGLLLTVWAMALGLLAGAVQGYFGGWTDIALQRVIEVWSALPFLYIMILVGSVMGRSFLLLLICYGLFNWIGLSYYLRAEFLRLRTRPFVEAARCQGLSHARIILRHILPNALTPVVTLLPFSLVGAIAALSALDFLGFGLPPLAPSWGELLQQAQYNRSAWWLVLFPSAALFLVMFLAVLIGEGLRDAFDPKPKTRLE